MRHKILHFTMLVILFGLWSCNPTQTISYEFTEKDSPFDTVIVVKNMKQYQSIDIEATWEWDDTIIYYGIKLPPQSYSLKRTVGNYDQKDTIHITFDKYKAKKVRVRDKKTYKRAYYLD